MFNRKQINLALAVSTVLLASSSVVNAEIANDTATVEVTNAFTLTSTTPINFGVLRVSQSTSAADVETPTRTILDEDGSQTSENGEDAGSNEVGSVTVITPGTPGRIDITGAAPFTNLTVAVDDTLLGFDGNALAGSFDGTSNVDLTTPGAASTEKFTMHVDASRTRIEGGTNNGSAYTPGAPNLRTDGTGAVGLTFGGILIYNNAATTTPPDGTYTGNYSITVSY